MDRDHLTRLIDDPSRVRREDMSDLKVMAERYPWFSGVHLLMAVGGHREGDVLFDEQLRVSAAHLPSRAVLFDRMAASPNDGLMRGLPLHADLADALAPMRVVRDDAPEPSPTAQPERPLIKQEPPVKREEPVAGSPSPAPQAPLEAEDPLDALIRGSAMATTYELLLEHEVKPLPTSVLAPAPPEVADPPASKVPPVVKHRSFSAWLNEEPVESVAAPTLPPVPVQRSVVAPTLERPVSVPAGEKSEPSATKPAAANEETKALIDRFILQHAPPTPKKVEFFTPQQAAKRSLEDHADMVTETLAGIYVKQGNTAKAIAAYERLAAKHPERRAYFLELARSLGAR